MQGHPATVGNEFMGWIDLWVTKASEVKKNGFICDKKSFKANFDENKREYTTNNEFLYEVVEKEVAKMKDSRNENIKQKS